MFLNSVQVWKLLRSSQGLEERRNPVREWKEMNLVRGGLDIREVEKVLAAFGFLVRVLHESQPGYPEYLQ